MKLYTEEQVRDFIDRNGCIVESDLDEKQLTPIELPSDEEIEEEALKREYFELSFFNGAKMVISKIQGGNK